MPVSALVTKLRCIAIIYCQGVPLIVESCSWFLQSMAHQRHIAVGVVHWPSVLCRAAQALVHSRSLATDVKRGVQLADTMMDKPGADEQFQRELIYLRAVGKYRSGKLLEARRQLDELLKVP